MKRFIAAVIGLSIGVAAAIVAFAVGGRTAPGYLAGPPAAFDPAVPAGPLDTGVGEEILLVVGGVFPSHLEAVDASQRLNFGDVQGYYVVPVAQFHGLADQLGEPGDFALVSAFRTREGAEEFAAFASAFAGAPARIVGPVVSLGGVYAGLGQEAHPNGQGPLTGPLVPSPDKGA